MTEERAAYAALVTPEVQVISIEPSATDKPMTVVATVSVRVGDVTYYGVKVAVRRGGSACIYIPSRREVTDGGRTVFTPFWKWSVAVHARVEEAAVRAWCHAQASGGKSVNSSEALQ